MSSSVPLAQLYCERSAQLDQRLARLADIDSDCELTDREENCDLLHQRGGKLSLYIRASGVYCVIEQSVYRS